MSLRCSLLGHDYGEAEIEREREEQGSEVVVTVREFKECDRCGNRSVVSENKEVTAIGSPAPDLESAEPDAPDATEPADGVGTATGGDSETDASEGSGGAEIVTDSPDGDGIETVTEAAETGTDVSPAVDNDFEQPQSAAEDDGVILDDDGVILDGGDRDPGEWPDAETTHPAEADEGGEWPEVGREDEGFDAEPGSEAAADVEFGGGLTPESAPETDEAKAEFVNADGDALQARETGDADAELSAGFTAGSGVPSVSGPADDPDVDAEFVCPECGYREGVAGSSLRAGDICPDCRKGYLDRE